jgi:hypothetical protein
MRVLIDDQRNLPADLICRNYKTGEMILTMFAFDIRYLMLDNDLGSPDPNDDGYKLACWLEERHADLGNSVLPEVVEIVTDNPPASAKMEQIFGKLYEFRKGRIFSKEQIK